MGFRDDSPIRPRRTGPKPASGPQMILIFVAIAVSALVGYWAPTNLPFRFYLPIPNSWYAPIVQGVPILPIQLIVGVIAFIVLQFFIVLISGIVFPLEPEELYDKDGLYLGKKKK